MRLARAIMIVEEMEHALRRKAAVQISLPTIGGLNETFVTHSFTPAQTEAEADALRELLRCARAVQGVHLIPGAH
jgi:uncharacterized protein YejL (UPF0352 family)